MINGRSVGEAWVKYLNFIIKNGTCVDDDKGKIIECDCAILKIKISDEDPIIDEFGNHKKVIAYCEKLFSQDIVNDFKVSYGQRLFAYNGINQVNWLINKLKKNSVTKSACISLLKAREESDDIPCLVSIQAKIRNNRLVLIVCFRSQNVLNSYANFISIFKLGQMIAEELEISLGRFVFFISSPHIYLTDIEEVKRILFLSQGKFYV